MLYFVFFSVLVTAQAGIDIVQVNGPPGEVASWGMKVRGGSGLPEAQNRAITNAISVGGDSHWSGALTSDGKILTWGSNSLGMQNVPREATNVVEAYFAWRNGIALRDDGELFVWGNSKLTNHPAKPTNGFPAKIVRVTAGDNHSAVLFSDGTVYSW